jgi:hypothetical protein
MRARRSGRHSYQGVWHFGGDVEAYHSIETILAWGRETLGSCRRPFGIDYFDLEVSVSQSGRRLASFSLSRLRPLALYASEVGDGISTLLERAGSPDSDSRLQVSAVIFSWGDAAHAALPAS